MSVSRSTTRQTELRTTKKAISTRMAAVSLAAVTMLGASAVPAGAASNVGAANISQAPAGSADQQSDTDQRIAGVHADMARAVELQQVTEEQAAFLAEQLVRRIHAGSMPA